MSRRRRAALLLGLALVLGGLAASDVSRREHAFRAAVGTPVAVVVARTALPAGAVLGRAQLAVRWVPSRYAPTGAYGEVADVGGLRTAVAVPAGADLGPALVAGSGLAAAPLLRPGERVAEIVATGSAKLVRAGGRVDVAITREGRDGAPGRTTLALEDAQVLSARAMPASSSSSDSTPADRVAVSLRVSLHDALALAEAQSFARELRVLPRASGDHT